MTKPTLETAVEALNETPATPAAQIMEMTEQGSSRKRKEPISRDIHVLLKVDTMQKLEHIADENGLSRNYLINAILRDYVNGAFIDGDAISSMYLKAVSVS